MTTAALVVLATTVAAEQIWKQASPDYRLVGAYRSTSVTRPEDRVVVHGQRRERSRPALGYQLTFFRVGVEFAPVNPSRLAVRDVFIAHAAVTDAEGGGISQASA